MRKACFICCLTLLAVSQVRGQGDSIGVEVPFNQLQIDHLNYPVDSSRSQVISAGRISRNLSELPLQVYVVTREEILRNQYTTLTDVLLALPGIQVSRPGTGEFGETFQVWNLTGNLYTKILINGIPVKPSVVAGMPIGSQLPVRQAERIEFIYGNASAVYGADAVSGVINIITKEADRGTFVQGDMSLGRSGHNYINFSIGGKGGKNNNILKYSFYGSRFEQAEMNIDYSDTDLYNPLNFYGTMHDSLAIDGRNHAVMDINESYLASNGIEVDDFIDRFYGPQYTGTLTQPVMEALGTESNMVGMQLAFRGLSLSFHYMYRKTHSSMGLSPVFYKYNNPQNFWGENIQEVTLAYRKDFGKFRSETQISSLAYAMDNNSNLGLTHIANMDKMYRFSASNDFDFSQVFSTNIIQNLELVLGFSFVQSGNLPPTNYMMSPYKRRDYAPFSVTMPDLHGDHLGAYGLNPMLFYNSSVFTQFFYQWRKFNILGGLRYDYNSFYNMNEVNPSLAVLHHTTPKTTLRLSLGRAYKIPPSALAYQSLAYMVDSSVFVVYHQNPDLKPERFYTIELGINTRITPRFSIEHTFFTYHISNHLMPRLRSTADIIPPNTFELPIANDSASTWTNFEGAFSTVGGAQTTLRFNNIIRAIKLNAEASVYFQARQDRMPNLEEFVQKYMTIAPAHIGKLKVSMQPHKNLYIYAESHWSSKWLRLLIPFEELYNGIFGSTDGYYAMNLTARYYLSDQLNTFIKVTNLFDEKYAGINATLLEQTLPYTPQYRRTVRIGLSYTLN